MFVICYVFTEGEVPEPVDGVDEVRISTDSFSMIVYRGENIPAARGRRVPLSFFYKVAETRGTASGMTREAAIATVDEWLDSYSATFPTVKVSIPADVVKKRPGLLDVQSKRDRKARYEGF